MMGYLYLADGKAIALTGGSDRHRRHVAGLWPVRHESLRVVQPINKTDSQGFLWDINRYGNIGNGTNNCFSGAASLRMKQFVQFANVEYDVG